ncbi:hypothetical protein VHEMI02577 [[Torrubiella] hemipterigena]|uniref:Uncharacterized protein n=1 Tax=[Torrubiella] hemipterigena TaxID=1531966 RepID=A0A0A1T8A8_9HYPO|nr:hypothetical protein VHEMI02577 [[Torrubiella] hemipterigena]
MNSDDATNVSMAAVSTKRILIIKYPQKQAVSTEFTKRNKCSLPSEGGTECDTEYRRHPVHVKKKSGGNSGVKAEPPPSNPPTLDTTVWNRPSNQRRTNRNGDGDDSDSDSGGGDPMVDSDDDGKKRKRTQPTEVGESSKSSSSTLLEDQERIRLFHTLRQVEENWEHIREYRQEVQANSVLNRLQLQRRFSDQGLHNLSSHELAQLTSFIKEKDKELHEYLKDALFHDIEAKLRGEDLNSNEPIRPTAYLEDILKRVEFRLIWRCKKFDVTRNNWGATLPKPQVRLVSIIQKMQKVLWDLVVQQDPGQRDIAIAIGTFVAENGFGPLSSSEGINNEEIIDTVSFANGEQSYDFLVDAYMTKVINGLTEAVMLDLEAGKTTPDPNNIGYAPT